MGDKYTVGEISKIFNISKQTIRYYDSLGLISPVATDKNNGYRYYSYEQFFDFGLIKLLREVGINLKTIQSYLCRKDIKELERILNQKISEYYRQIESIEKMIEHTQNMYDMIRRREGSINPKDVEITSYPVRYFKCIEAPFKTEDIYIHIRSLYEKVIAEKVETDLFLNTQLILSMTKESMEAHNFSEYGLIGFQIATGGPQQGGRDVKAFPSGEYVKMLHFGSYQTIGTTYEKMIEAVARNGMEIAGDSFEISHIDIKHTNDPNEFITEIQIPVRRLGEGK